MRLNRAKTLLFLLIFPLATLAETNRKDELLKAIKESLSKHEATRLEQNAAMLLSLSHADDDIAYQLEALKYLGIAKHLQAKYDSAVMWYHKALALSVELKDWLNVAKSYLNMATSYNSKGDFELAVKNALQSLKLFETVGDKNGQGRVQNLLGIFYFNRNDFENALRYFSRYHELALVANDTGEIVSSMNNMASTLHSLNKFGPERELLRQSIAIQEAQGQHIRIGSAYENLGTLYLETDSLALAAKYFEKARKAYDANNNTYDIARLLLQTGRLKKRINNFNEATSDFKKSLDISAQGGFLEMKKEALHQLALLYEERSDFKNAYFALADYMEAKDSVLNEQNQESINKLMIEFETEKKERKIAQQQLEISWKTLQNRKKSGIIVLLSGALVILLLLSALFYSRIKIKQERKLNSERMQMKQSQLKVVLESQENERKRFARDLHDGFGQLITAVKILLSQLHKTSDSGKRSEMALKSNEILDTMHKQLREIAHNLMPEQLVSDGLVSALNDYAFRMSKNTGIQIEINAFGMDKRLDQAIEINVYRIIQEWINNVIKYADAKQLTIQLTGYEHEINVLVEDNGKGFEKEKLTSSPGWGWKNIQSRLEAINGILEIDTREGIHGTSFIMDLPVSV